VLSPLAPLRVTRLVYYTGAKDLSLGLLPQQTEQIQNFWSTRKRHIAGRAESAALPETNAQVCSTRNLDALTVKMLRHSQTRIEEIIRQKVVQSIQGTTSPRHNADYRPAPGYMSTWAIPLCSIAALLLPQGLGASTAAPTFCVFCRTFISAPGRIRTCDRRIRSPLLCPLSYGRIRLIYAEFSPPGSSRKTPGGSNAAAIAPKKHAHSASSIVSANPPSIPLITVE
jgi:hypothetical protein